MNTERRAFSLRQLSILIDDNTFCRQMHTIDASVDYRGLVIDVFPVTYHVASIRMPQAYVIFLGGWSKIYRPTTRV